MSEAPVCHIPPEVDSDLTPFVRQLPSIPTVTPGNWQSLIAAINALTMGYQMLSGMRPMMQINNSRGGGVIGGKGNRPAPPGRWTQLVRQYETVRITNPQDKTQFVDVRRVKRLVMRDSVTGEQWIYNQ